MSYADLMATDDRVGRFRQGIRFRTVSTQPEGDYNPEEVFTPSSADELLKLAEFIQNQYPVLHSSPLVEREVVNTYSLLYTIRGQNTDLRPYLLAAHLDVVPADDDRWQHPPFEAEVVDGEIHGRGTLDMKATLFSIVECFEYLLSQGFRPQRSVYLAFGHDEEIGGYQGAKKIAQLLESRNVDLEFVLDEGTGVVMGAVPGLDPEQKMGLIAVAEKGYATVEFRVSMAGGHSSVPARESSIGVLASAMARLESNPQPSMFGRGPEAAMLKYAAPKMSFLHRFIMSNLWLFGRLVSWLMSKNRAADSVQRTTTAITMFHAGVKSNVIAQEAVATVNHRIHPAQTLEQVLDHDRRVINDDRVKVKVRQYMPVGRIAPYTDQTFGFSIIRRSLLAVYPDAIASPGLMMANTDSRFYESFSRGVYKFTPWVGTIKVAELIHGNDERVALDTYEKMMNFYKNVIIMADRASLD